MPWMMRMLRFSIAACVLLGVLTAFGSAHVWGQTPVVVQPESQFWIEGSSTVNTFTCRVERISGHGRINAAAPSSHDTTASQPVEAMLTVPVRTFDCGNRRMTHDLYEALKANTYPTIQYELDTAYVATRPDTTDGWYQLRAQGELTIAGTERPIEISARGRRLAENRFRIRGRKPLEMTDFGIEPPTKFLGLIRVHDRIEVYFDLFATTASPMADSSTGQSSYSDDPINQSHRDSP